MHKVLILAAGGMAGHVIAKVLSQNTNLQLATTTRVAINKYEFGIDLKDQNSLLEIVRSFKPHTVINCAGILVQRSKEDPAQAVYINSYLPQFLNNISTTENFKLIHISTDCVFSGKKGQYSETDEMDAKDYYGKTKALGEINNDANLTIRTSIIGPELKPDGTGLLHWFLKQTGDIKGFSNAIWSGVTTKELAQFINKIINTAINTNNNINGLYHLTNNQAITKYDLLNLFKQTFNTTHINIHADASYSCDKSLLNNRGNLGLDYNVPSYRQMLAQLRDFMLANQDLYSQYNICANTYENTISY